MGPSPAGPRGVTGPVGPIGPAGPTGPTGPTGINAAVLPLSNSAYLATGGATATSAVFQASYTGGAPGAVTYAWEFVSNPDAMTFLNPLGSSSQRVVSSFVPAGIVETATFRCKITDAQGNISYTETATFSVEREGFEP